MEEKNSDTYLSVSSPSGGLYKEKGSRFISFLVPVSDVEEARAHIERLRREYHDARHCCYAWRIGPGGELWRMNDDGEPSSTAGRPIFGQILSHSLSDVLIVVIRYFGGVKLGVPGLINAYRNAAADAIAHAVTVTRTASERLSFRFSYQAMNNVMKVIREYGPDILSREFGLECSMTVSVRLRDSESLRERITGAGAVCS